MVEMAALTDFPGALPTNTYILQDYFEIAYIVCTAAVSATVDETSDIQDATNHQPTLTRLKNAEEQFRQASILTILDVEKLELFTFYKKADIVRDQKTVLTKFGQVCKLNHCGISYKNTCRVIELLKPENTRVYRLFTAAIISSIQIRPACGGEPVKMNSQRYLLPSTDVLYDEWSPTAKPLAQWYLVRLDLQIVSSGQILFSVRPSVWPTLTAVTDLIDPDVCPGRFIEGSPLLLVPSGCLASYTGNWTTSMHDDQDVAIPSSNFSASHPRWRAQFISKAKDWLDARPELSSCIAADVIWLEAKIPTRSSTGDANGSLETLKWKTVFWPAALSYTFTSTDNTDLDVKASDMDPFSLATEWYLHGAAAVPLQGQKGEVPTQTNKQVDDQTFDDEGQFESPQQFSGMPSHAFAQGQTVYPTPPEVPLAQATPGMSVDGAGQTPATLANMSNVPLQSSPIAMMTDGSHGPATAQAISNFLNHNEDDDLFDDIDDEKMRPSSFADEPNWDFFNTESVDIPSTDKPLEDDIPMITDESPHPHDNEAFEDMSTSSLQEIPEGPQNEAQSHVPTVGAHAGGGNKVAQVTVTEESNKAILPALYKPVGTRGHIAPHFILSTSRRIVKRRRSSAYDVSPPEESNRDDKYSTRGKYYFASRLSNDLSMNSLDLGSSTRHTSSSATSTESSSERSADGVEEMTYRSRPWTNYEPDVVPVAPDTLHVDEFDAVAADAEIRDLLRVIQAAPNLEPFIAPMSLTSKAVDYKVRSASKDSMAIQILTEQLTQSSLLRNNTRLSIPGPTKLPPFEVLTDRSSSNAILMNALLTDLTGMQHSSVPARAAAKIAALKHSKVKLRQADNDITAELSMAKFWEVLNLQPISGSKNALALCLHPRSDKYKNGCDSFLQRISETYTACNLGVHLRIALKDICEDGLVAWDTTEQLYTLCEQIGENLATQESEDCTVVYIIIPDDDLWKCRQLCDAFLGLFEALERSRQDDFGDVVLQLVPSSLVVGKDTVNIAEEQQFVALALEVYNRLPPNPDSLDPSLCAPATVLSEPEALTWHFELNAQHISPLARHGKCCHLAYCISLDERWLVASWSDTIGKIAMTISYPLKNDEGSNVHSRLDVFKHMCKATCDTMNQQREKWWLAIAKVGLYTTSELQDWSLATAKLPEQSPSLSRIVLVSVELQPRLTLPSTTIPLRTGQPTSLHLAPNSLSTPISTPQAISTTSPDQSVPMTPTAALGWTTTAPTPPDLNADAGNEGEIMLTDSTEDTWIVTLPFGINQSLNYLEIKPALASGLILKRPVPLDSSANPLTVLGVNLIYMPRKVSATNPNPPQDREQVLEEILAEYQGLHSLALARHCIDSQSNCAPWHVATAFKGAKILEQLV